MSTHDPIPSYPEDNARGLAGQRPGAVEQPPSIKTAVTLMRVGAGLALLSVVYTMLTLSGLKADLQTELATADTNLTTSELDTAFKITVASAVVVGALGAALWLWMAWANGRGRKWARIVASVLGALNIAASLFSILLGQSTMVSTVFTVANLVVGVAALYYLYRPDSNQFYAACSRPAY